MPTAPNFSATATRQSSDRAADLESLRGLVARAHRSLARAPRARDSRRRRRRSRAHNTTHFSVVDRDGQRGRQHLPRSISATGSALSPRAPASCSTTSSTISPPSRARPTRSAWSAAPPTRRPGKRPLSSMTPTIVLKNGKPLLVTGAPGGSRIITTVLQVVVNAIDFQEGIADAVAAPRVHHQWQPDVVLDRARLSGCDHPGAAGARSHRPGRPGFRLCALNCGDAEGACRSCRCAVARRAGRRLLKPEKPGQDAKRRGAINRPSSRRALFEREPSPGIRIGLASLRGRKTAAARQTPADSRAGSRNNSRTMPAGLIGIKFLPVLK